MALRSLDNDPGVRQNTVTEIDEAAGLSFPGECSVRCRFDPPADLAKRPQAGGLRHAVGNGRSE
jgi:hypothetical protein